MRSARILLATAALLALGTGCVTVQGHHPTPAAHGRITALVHITERAHTVKIDKPMTICTPDRKTKRTKCQDVTTGRKETRRIVDRRECWQVTLATGTLCTTSARWHTLRIGSRW